MTSHPQETIAQRLHRKGIKLRRDIILSDADLSNGINIEINGVLLPVDWDKHEALLEDRGGFSYPLALNLDNYDWVPFVDSESELQVLMDALSAAAPYDELTASLIIPKDFDSPIRVFRRSSYDTASDHSLYASDFDPDSSYEIFSLDLTPNSASIFQVIEALGDKHSPILSYEYDPLEEELALLTASRPELVNTSYGSLISEEGTFPYSMTPEYVVGAVAFRDMISYLYSTQVSMPHLIDPNSFSTSEKSIWDTYQYHGILPTYAIRFSLHPLPGSDSFTASVNGIRTPDIPTLSPDDLIWYPFASNLEDLKAIHGTLTALFNHYKATMSLDNIGLYFSPGINGYALLTLTTAEGDRLNFNFKLPSLSTLTLKDLNQSLSKEGFDLTLSDFSDHWSDGIPYAVIAPPALSLPEWNTTTDQGTLKPSDTLSQSLLQASHLLSRSLGMFTPIPEQNSPFLASFLTQTPAWDTPSLALTVFPESLVVNGEDYIVNPSSEDAFLSSPILSQVFGSLSCYQDTLRVLSNLRETGNLDRIILTIPQSPSDYITLLTNRNLGDKAERYYLGLKQGVTPETLPQFIEKSWSYLYRKGVVARSSWDLKAVTNTSSEPLLQHKNPVLKGYSPAIPKFLRVLLRGFSDSLEQVDVISPIFRDFLEKMLSSHRKKKIIEITDLPSIYTANDLYSTILQIQGYYSLHDVKDFLTGRLSDKHDPLAVSDAVLIAAFEAFFTRGKNLLFDPKRFTVEGYSREESFILLCDFLQVAPIKHAYAMIPYQLDSYEYHEGKSKLSYSEISLQDYLSHLERSIVPFTPLSFTSPEGLLKDIEGIPIENLHVATYDWGTILRFPTSLPYATQGIIFNKDNLQDFEQLGDMLKDYTFYLYTGVARSRYKWLTFTDPTSLLSHFDFFVDTPRGFPENLTLPVGTFPRISTILNGLKADPESFLNFLRSSSENLGKEPDSTTHPRIKEIQEFFDAP